MKKLNADRMNEAITKRSCALIGQGRLAEAEIIVNQCGKRVFHGFFGGAEPQSLYRAASMTKPVTTVALLQQVQSGSVDLMAPVSDYLPDYAQMNVGHLDTQKRIVTDRASTGIIRVYMLLCHTSGIGTSPLCEAQRLPFRSVRDTAEYYAHEPLAFDPFTAQSYSPTAAFDVAARIVELTSGEDFDSYVQNHICRPLGMKDTVFIPKEEQWQRIVPMHSCDGEGKAIRAKMPEGCVFETIPPQACAAGAGLLTCAEDYSRFAEMLLNGGEDILSETLVRRMRMPHVPESLMDASERWGLGVRVITRPDYPHGLPVGCFGWSGAYGTHFWVDPENRITAVYMKNSIFDGGAGCHTGCMFEEDVTAALAAN